MLAYASVETGARPRTQVDLNVALHDALNNLSDAIRSEEAEIVDEELPVVSGDKGQLVQVFQNLIGNALKYRSEEPPRIRVTARRREEDWLVSVTDNGIGVAPGNEEKIFKKFQRIELEKRRPGDGIGLAICEQIVNGHGGRIWVESTLGKGSTFHFTIPLRPEERK